MKFYAALPVVALFALGACDQNSGGDATEDKAAMQYADKSCEELKTLKDEYMKAGEAIATQDDANAAAAVAGLAGAATGNVVAGAVAANAIGEDMQEQRTMEAGEEQLMAIKEAAAAKNCEMM